MLIKKFIREACKRACLEEIYYSPLIITVGGIRVEKTGLVSITVGIDNITYTKEDKFISNKYTVANPEEINMLKEFLKADIVTISSLVLKYGQ